MNISISELLVVLLIALLVIKPEQLPEVARSLGKMFRSVRQLFAKCKNEMNSFLDTVENESKREQT